MAHRQFSLLVWWCVAGMAACGSDGEAPPSDPVAELPDSESVAVPFELVEVARFGASSVEAFALGRVRDIGVDAMERVYAVDQYSRSLKVFDRLGFVREVGREGSGPGEFMDPVGLLFPNDSTLLTIDYRNGRYSIFDTSGVHRNDHPRARLGSLWPWPGVIDSGRVLEPVVRTGDYQLAAVDLASLAAPSSFFPYPLADVPAEEWRPVVYRRTEQSVQRVPIPYRPGYTWTLDGRGGVWVGNTAAYEVRHAGLDGTLLGELRRSVRPVQVTPTERAEAISSLGENVPAEDVALIPDQKPFFRAIWPTEDGVLVVREGDGDSWSLDVFDLEYSYRGSVALPERPNLEVRPVWRGANAWVVVLDSLDVQTIVQWSVENR